MINYKEEHLLALGIQELLVPFAERQEEWKSLRDIIDDVCSGVFSEYYMEPEDLEDD